MDDAAPGVTSTEQMLILRTTCCDTVFAYLYAAQDEVPRLEAAKGWGFYRGTITRNASTRRGPTRWFQLKVECCGASFVVTRAGYKKRRNERL